MVDIQQVIITVALPRLPPQPSLMNDMLNSTFEMTAFPSHLVEDNNLTFTSSFDKIGYSLEVALTKVLF